MSAPQSTRGADGPGIATAVDCSSSDNLSASNKSGDLSAGATSSRAGRSSDAHRRRQSSAMTLEEPFAIVFDQITLQRTEGTGLARGSRRTTNVIENASGVVKCGRLTAVVSCCGRRGDYYLLNALAGNDVCASGSITANGTPVHAPTYRDVAPLVDEDMTLLENLTVAQNLEYSAEMRSTLGSMRANVETVIQQLALEVVRDKPVRACNEYTRRRVSVGKELVLGPLAVFVDAPTHGLPTHEAVEFLTVLHDVVEVSRRAVVITMVQPRWTFLKAIDDVILVEGSTVVFCGPTTDLVALIQVPDAVPESWVNSVYRTATSPHTSLADAFARSSNHATVAAEVSRHMALCASGQLSLQIPDEASRKKGGPAPPLKLLRLMKYAVLEVKNSFWMYFAFTASLLVVAMVLAAIYSGQSGQSGMQNRIGIIFFLVSSTFLHNILCAELHRKSFLSFLRHRAAGYYGPLTYTLYWLITSAFVRFFNSAVFVGVVYSVANIEEQFNYTSLQSLVVIVALTSFSTALLVFVITMIVPSTRIAHLVLFAFYSFNILTAGIILNANTLPRPFQMVTFASHIRLGYEAAIVSQFDGQTFGCAPSVPTTMSPGTPEPTPALILDHTTTDGVASGISPFSNTVAPDTGVSMRLFSTMDANNANATTPTPTTAAPQQRTYCYTGDEYMRFLGFDKGNEWWNVAVMGYVTLGLAVLCYLVLLLYRPQKRIEAAS